MTNKMSVFVLDFSTGLASRFYVDSTFDEDDILEVLEDHGIENSDAQWMITSKHNLNEL